MKVKAKHRGIQVQRVVAREYINNTAMTGKMPVTKAVQIASLINEMTGTNSLASADIVKNPKNFIYTSRQSDVAAIIGAAVLKRKNWQRCEVGSVFVAEASRCKGYGTKVVQSAVERAANRNFKVLEAVIDETNAPSQALFTKSGFAKKFIYYDSLAKSKYGAWERTLEGCSTRKKNNKRSKHKVRV